MAGIIDTIKLAGTLVLAIPAALAGLEFLVNGNALVGGVLVSLAVLLVVVQHYVTTPADLPGMVAKRVVGSVVSEPDGKSEDDDDVIDVTPDEDRP